MNIVPTSMTLTDYCKDQNDHKIIVNRDYQRSNKVWPAAAQSFLIESVLLGYPVPKVALYQITDRATRETQREIIDGQQRSEAFRRFYNNELTLSRTLEGVPAARGKTYDGLDEGLQDRFLSYMLQIDLFVDATPQDVREIFRRINSYEVPLNPEEQRHAQWQGAFKWFIYHLSKNHDADFIEISAFSSKQLVRMADMKLLAELSHAILNGISVTSKKSLDDLYKGHDSEFADEEPLGTAIDDAIASSLRWTEIYDTGLTKPYAYYSLLLAIIQAQVGFGTLVDVGQAGVGLRDDRLIVERLSELAEALDSKDVQGADGEFVKASTDGTNRKAQRLKRAQVFYEAVAQD